MIEGQKQDRLVVHLSEVSGNAVAIINQCEWAMSHAHWPSSKISAVKQELMAGDYDHLLRTVMEKFEVR